MGVCWSNGSKRFASRRPVDALLRRRSTNSKSGSSSGGIGILLKFWIHISQEEQLRRFQERERTPWKLHKITEEDWRNRERWETYRHAVNDMVTRTSTESAPWTLVAGNDKKAARVQVLDTFCERIENALAGS